MRATAPPAERTRARPWRRHSTPAPTDLLAPLVTSYRAHHPKADVSLVQKAYRVADDAHREQVRRSGEAYIHHPVAVARIVADLGLDDVTISSALLHDAVEDTGLTLEDVARDFGAEVAAIVDGVTKLDRVSCASMRKMLVAMAKDWRVLIIKLADRLHNMRTIAGLPDRKQRRTAQETLDIYAPLAHRLGIQVLQLPPDLLDAEA
ncbi:MAG TPA: HD domain-containing protein, partial [Acidimicrobiales bacterium]|nr:HD domain-containing protein [Acidimicrobiales bacterium]